MNSPSRLQHQLLPEFPACWLTVRILGSVSLENSDTQYESNFVKTKLKTYRDASRLTMKLHPDKPISSKYHVEMHLIHLIYRTSQFSLHYLKCAQNIYISLQLGKIIQYNEYTVEYGLLPFEIMCLTGSRGSLSLPSITTKYPTEYHQPRKRSKLKMRGMVSEYYFHITIKLKIVSRIMVSQRLSLCA